MRCGHGLVQSIRSGRSGAELPDTLRAVSAALIRIQCERPALLQLCRRVVLACQAKACATAAPKSWGVLLRRLRTRLAGSRSKMPALTILLHLSKSGGSSVCALAADLRLRLPTLANPEFRAAHRIVGNESREWDGHRSDCNAEAAASLAHLRDSSRDSSGGRAAPARGGQRGHGAPRVGADSAYWGPHYSAIWSSVHHAWDGPQPAATWPAPRRTAFC